MNIKFDLFIPVWNIRERGFDRLKWLLESCKYQTVPFHRIWICDGSHPKQQPEIAKIAIEAEKNGLPIVYEYGRLMKFNKPILINRSAWNSDADIFIFSDVDYLFSPDLVEVTREIVRYDRFLIHESKNLPHYYQPNAVAIREWLHPETHPNGFPVHVACGAWMVHTRDFFRYSRGLNEKMSGMSGMDEEYLKRAKLHGLEVREIKEGEVLHQYHRPIKGRTPTADQQRNWRLLESCVTVIQNT